MSRKYPLTTQTRNLFIVIRKTGKETPKKSLVEAYCKEFFTEYAMIEHTNDKDPITGEIVPTHFHIVGKANKTKTPMSTHLNDLVKYFRFENANGIEIDKYDNEVKAIQYLIHKNQPEKTSHKVSEVLTTFSKEDLTNIMASETGETINFDLVYVTCKTSNNIVEVIKAIGFHTYHKYRNTIKDIFECVQTDKRKAILKEYDEEIRRIREMASD